jgi:tryptophan 7-halogenase
MMPEAIKKIVVVGKDADAWITALFLKSGLDKTSQPVEILLVEQPTALTRDDFYCVLPSIKNLHKALGANEHNLASSAKAQHVFAQKFVAWNKDANDFKHAYEKLGINFNSIDFYQYWLRASTVGLQVPLEEFCLGTTLTRHPDLALHQHLFNNSNPPVFGYHLCAQHYVAAVAKACLYSGVTHIASRVTTVKTEQGKITGISLENGSEINADLFIDATGSDRVLIDRLGQNNFCSWSDKFLCDRVINTRITAFEPKPSFSLITAFSCGWYGLHPLSDSTALKICYSSKHSNKHDVLKEVSRLLGTEFKDLPEQTIAHGKLTRPWIGNCIAVGNAVATMDGLDALDLQALLLSLVELRSLFPVNTDHQLEADIYNRHLAAYLENLHDFQLSHYLLNGRTGEAFWDDCRNITASSKLADKIQLFKVSGKYPVAEFETFQQESWTQIMNGHGLRPKQHEPLADNMPEQELMQQLSHLLRKLGDEARELAPLSTTKE